MSSDLAFATTQKCVDELAEEELGKACVVELAILMTVVRLSLSSHIGADYVDQRCPIRTGGGDALKDGT